MQRGEGTPVRTHTCTYNNASRPVLSWSMPSHAMSYNMHTVYTGHTPRQATMQTVEHDKGSVAVVPHSI